MEPSILYETEDFLILNKPSGLIVHRDGKRETPALTDWLLQKYPLLKGVGEPMKQNEEEIDRPGIVHRLDEDTSGVLVVAKTQEAFLYLKSLFMKREIEKSTTHLSGGTSESQEG